MNCPQIHKALELYTQLRQRMGVVIVGPSGSGKTTVWNMLKTALNHTGSTVNHIVLNPKAMPRTQVQYVFTSHSLLHQHPPTHTVAGSH